MAFYFALFNVANANQEIRDQHHYRRQSIAQNLAENQSRDRRRHSVSSSSSNRSFFSDFRLLPRPKVVNPSVDLKNVLNDVNISVEQSPCKNTQTYSNRQSSSPSPTLSPAGSCVPCSSTAMTMSASARFHHNTEKSPCQTPHCSPTPQECTRQVQEVEHPIFVQQTSAEPVKIQHLQENKSRSTPISIKPQSVTSTPCSKKVTFMSVSASNEFFERAKRERQRKLSADNISNFLDLGDLAAWNMKAVIVPRHKPHRHTADPSRHKEPFIEIPSNKNNKNLAQPQQYLLRRGSAAAEIRLPDRQQRRVSAQPDRYCGAGSVGAKQLTSLNGNNNNILPRSPRIAKVQRSKSSRTADAMEMATVKALRVLRRQRRNSAEEKQLEKEKKAFGNDLNLISSSPSQRKLQAELKGHIPKWLDQGLDAGKSRQHKSIIRRRSTSDQHSFTEGRRRNTEEVQWKILNNYIQKSPGRRTRECSGSTASNNKVCNGDKGYCEVCRDHLDIANVNANVSIVAEQVSIIPRQAISITAPEAMPLMPNTKLDNKKKTEDSYLEMFKSNMF